MPYLSDDLMIGEQEVRAGMWVPEHNWDRWTQRGADVEQYMTWRRRPSDDGRRGPEAPDDLHDRMMSVMAGDMASAQRDAHLYRNLIERLKNAPSDETADEVVDRMQTLGMASASWPEDVGGPPPHHSPRLWGPVLDWLLRLAAQAARFIFALVDGARKMLSKIGVATVGVGLSWSPEVSFEFETPDLLDDQLWARARRFLDDTLAELEEKVFS